MRCLKLTVALAVLLAMFANARCVAKCAVTPCDQSSSDVPPCHRHPAPGSRHCSTPVFVSTARIHQLLTPAIVFETEAIAPPRWQALARTAPAPPTPAGSAPSFLILRV
ncbi:MAG TPA: hypothetical protein VMB03_05605 [Bryobacteraceae bacterium]|nr:hypothetical protein [Bryobacteraceae bacterium]